MIVFFLILLAFLGTTLVRLLCYKPFMKRFKIFGRKTKSMPSYNFNYELSVRQLQREFKKTKAEIRVYEEALKTEGAFRDSSNPIVKQFISRLRQKLRDIISRFDELLDKYDIPKTLDTGMTPS